MVTASCIARGGTEVSSARSWLEFRAGMGPPATFAPRRVLAQIGIRVYSAGVRGQRGDLTAALQRTENIPPMAEFGSETSSNLLDRSNCVTQRSRSSSMVRAWVH